MKRVEKYRAADGVELPVFVRTQATGKLPALMLHSLFFDGGMFEDCLPVLAKDRTVVAPTFRGQGGAGLGRRAPTVAQLAEDVTCVLDLMGISRVHVVGSSMGGYVALELLRAWRGEVVSLTLSCCTSERERNPERFAALSGFIATGPHADTGLRVSNIMFGATSVAAPTRTVSRWIDRFAQTPPAMSAVIDAMFDHPAYDDVLAGYGGPALLFAGSEDRAKSSADMARIATLLKAARLIEMERVGHTPPVEAPEAFAAAVAAFLAQHDAPMALNDGGRQSVH